MAATTTPTGVADGTVNTVCAIGCLAGQLRERHRSGAERKAGPEPE